MHFWNTISWYCNIWMFFFFNKRFLQESSVNLSKKIKALIVLLSLDLATACLTESGWPGAILYSWQSRLSEIWFLPTTCYNNVQSGNNKTALWLILWPCKAVLPSLWFPFLSFCLRNWAGKECPDSIFYEKTGENLIMKVWLCQRHIHRFRNTAGPESKFKMLLTLIKPLTNLYSKTVKGDSGNIFYMKHTYSLSGRN